LKLATSAALADGATAIDVPMLVPKTTAKIATPAITRPRGLETRTARARETATAALVHTPTLSPNHTPLGTGPKLTD
jgi:hypothetical protein